MNKFLIPPFYSFAITFCEYNHFYIPLIRNILGLYFTVADLADERQGAGVWHPAITSLTQITHICVSDLMRREPLKMFY